jgi:3-hydroxyacyl-[acyl-carrier-protein] dehydratase
MIGTAELHDRLPHRYPMLLIDRILELVPGDHLTAIKAVTCNKPWYRGLGDVVDRSAYAYPPALLIESWCQAAGVLAGWERASTPVAGGPDSLVALFGSMSGVTLLADVWPGDLVRHEVRVVRAFSDTWIFEGESTVDGRPVLATGQAVVALRPGAMLRGDLQGALR